MTGYLLMGVVLAATLYLLLGRALPAMRFRYHGNGERLARAQYARIKRENPDSPEARLTEPEFVEKFVGEGPRPWRYLLASGVLVLLGIPASCVIVAGRVVR